MHCRLKEGDHNNAGQTGKARSHAKGAVFMNEWKAKLLLWEQRKGKIGSEMTHLWAKVQEKFGIES